jgi:aryl-alcohol dehydrogenase-like predicted oxidoreductase
MKYRPLGRTGLELPILSFGASSLGQEFHAVDLNEAVRAVRVALDCGLTFIDTSPYYGRGMSEVLLGVALRDVPRDKYLLGTKLGRYDKNHFDFSPRRVAESVDVSLHRMGVEHLDICLCHDIEFVDMQRVVDETIPALREVQRQGKVRFIGVSGYPMNLFRFVLDRTELDVVLSYNHYTLQNTMLADLAPYLRAKGVGVMNAAPFAARLLTNDPLPAWHKAIAPVREACRRAAARCKEAGSDIAKLALQFSVANPEFSTCVTGSANPKRIRQWAEWIEEPIDAKVLAEVFEILKPVHNWHHIEGRPENNDKPVTILES